VNLLAIGPHPDDIEIGCAGAILKWREKGFKVYLMVMTDGSSGGNSSARRKEQERSAALLGAVDTIEDSLRKIKPAFVLVNYPEDTHQDHRALSAATISAARNSKNVLFYEGPTSIEFNPTVFVDISLCMEQKMEALKAHESQIHKTNIDGVSILEIATAMAHFRGTQGRVRYGEGFQALRLFVNI